MREVKDPKDPALKLLCEHGFASDKRKMVYDGMPVLIKEDENNQKVIFGYNPENGEWWISEDYLDIVMVSILLVDLNQYQKERRVYYGNSSNNNSR